MNKCLYIGDALPNPVFQEFSRILAEVKHNPALYKGRYSCDEETAWQRYNLDLVHHAVPSKTRGDEL